MLLRKKIQTLFLFFSIIGVIFYSLYNEFTLKPFDFEQVEKHVYRFQTFDAELNEAVVLSRYGLLEQYDPINSSLTSLEERMQELEKIASTLQNDELHAFLIKLRTTLQIKTDLVEQFKKENASLKIDILQFSKTLSKIIEAQSHEEVVESCLSGQFSYELTDLTNTLYRDMLVYVNSSNPTLRHSLTNTVTKIRTLQETGPDLLNGLLYADLILTNLPSVETLTKQIFNVPLIAALTDVNTSFRAQFDEYLNKANFNRILLYLFAALLLCLLILAVKRIQSTISQLKATQEDLRLVNQGLEDRVKDRTQQLTAKNKDLKKTLKKLKSTQEQLVLQEKMASVGMLTAGISHELKNPLNFVNNFSEASSDLIKDLKSDLTQFYSAPSDKLKNDIDEILVDLDINTSKILEHGKRADKIVENMRLHMQSGSAAKATIDVNKLLEEQIDLAYHQTLAQNKDFQVSIIKNLDTHVGKMSLIPQTMGRAMVNIMMNAMFYLQKKQSLASDAFQPELIITTQKMTDKIVIKFHDNGMGIPEKNLRKIFEPFFTTKPTGVGTGLGLSIAYDTIVKEHGGDIRVNSAEGEFTEFVIELPSQKL